MTYIPHIGALVWEGLGWAYDRTEHDRGKAIASYERAIALDPNDQRLFYELDVLYDAARVDPEKRLALLEEHHAVLHDNNVSDALAREVLLLALVGRYDDALDVIGRSYFRQWEGVSKAYGTFVDAHLLRGLDDYDAGRFPEALSDFEAALQFPKSIHEAGLTHETAGAHSRTTTSYSSRRGSRKDTRSAPTTTLRSWPRRRERALSKVPRSVTAMSAMGSGRDDEAPSRPLWFSRWRSVRFRKGCSIRTVSTSAWASVSSWRPPGRSPSIRSVSSRRSARLLCS
jgi:tetratricopeptide (TPR) repeat protein